MDVDTLGPWIKLYFVSACLVKLNEESVISCWYSGILPLLSRRVRVTDSPWSKGILINFYGFRQKMVQDFFSNLLIQKIFMQLLKLKTGQSFISMPFCEALPHINVISVVVFTIFIYNFFFLHFETHARAALTWHCTLTWLLWLPLQWNYISAFATLITFAIFTNFMTHSFCVTSLLCWVIVKPLPIGSKWSMHFSCLTVEGTRDSRDSSYDLSEEYSQ